MTFVTIAAASLSAQRPLQVQRLGLSNRCSFSTAGDQEILVTLGKFSEPARNAAIASTPAVDLIDGERISELILEQELGVRLSPRTSRGSTGRLT